MSQNHQFNLWEYLISLQPGGGLCYASVESDLYRNELDGKKGYGFWHRLNLFLFLDLIIHDLVLLSFQIMRSL